MYDGQYLSAMGNLVVVVPNYRVGIMGFFGGDALPGNLGIRDQEMALSWILENISAFGGNASRIVLAGHDAGATSLGYHLYSGNGSLWNRAGSRLIFQAGGPFRRSVHDCWRHETCRAFSYSNVALLIIRYLFLSPK